ncbi:MULTISPECIES: TetR/AcrR family transcriptional regulator [unclassified Novosphingobium]|uniref:TetR/AcrR family transcriptional regulator n=1 Tax=unclassified Novosphingobium TaxID=2644732 RepID=UPI00086C3CEF|nr:MULTISPECIES: TetR/AcrR family transcriptional regulator [unclassified Novosphingobium]MDR6707438.1 AcrR family transcriptional regulator [Novosphingobium sp. 1748]ODU83367.1 MAG: TetR family transcriptional regulator [Novosphingobium sp. SCN 63-17]OJX96364.1 MAG: TetR family transcriptional regulator [Novosphingobium sp. 63-713]
MAKAKTYHKEDLRRDLLAAARAHVAEHGHLSLSLRSLAQQVGVSTAAPYYHFTDRRALLLAVAIEGFAELNTDASAIADSPAPVADQLLALGEAFLDFAARQPRLVELMYESELTSPEIDPALLACQDRAYRTLLNVMQAALPAHAPVETSVRVMAFWSAIYGYAMLRSKLMLKPFEPSDLSAQAVDSGVLAQAVKAALVD